MKTAVSIPETLFRAAERFAQKHQVSRSRLYSLAVDDYLKAHSDDEVEKRLDEVYAEISSHLDPGIVAMQSISVAETPEEEWGE
jgi:metal-responsive CopG/Arc/MetJ family transcriptional regulator